MGGFDLPALVDPELSLAALSTRIHERFDRIDHFVLRYEHCLPILCSDSSDPLHRIVAAYVCHQPYRSLTDDARLHPFRDAILNAARETDEALSKLLLQLVQAPDDKLEGLASLSLSSLWSQQRTQSKHPPTSSLQDLLSKATQRTLSMGEQRLLLSNLQSVPPSRSLVDSVSPAELVLIAVNHPILTTELIIRIAQELLDGPVPGQPAKILQRYCEALSQLSPSPRSFDVITRLLRSNASAPAPLSDVATSNPLKTTVAHLARLYILGAFISNSITVLEQSEAQQESLIITDLNESGLAPFDRREVELRLEEAMARQVGSFCHFITSLLNSALLFPPDLGSLRRHISANVGEEHKAELLRIEVQSMESDLQSMTEATLIELKHFALRFGRYGDGTRLFSQLSSVV